MTERSPFEAQTPPPPPPGVDSLRPRGTSGCGTPLLVGCGILTVIVGIAGVLFAFQAKRLLVWAMERVEAQVVAGLPADVAAEERAAFTSAFDGAVAAIREGRMDPAALQKLQGELMHAAEGAGQKRLTREDVLRLTAALAEVARGPEVEPASAPAPAPATPQP